MRQTIIKFTLFTLVITTAISCSSTTAVNNQTANTSAATINNNAAGVNQTVNANAAVSNANAGNVSQTAAPSIAPDALVADLYKQHDAEKSPFFQSKNRALVDKYFTKATAGKIWKDAVDSNRAGEPGALGADPLYDVQDTDIKKFAVGKGKVTGKKAVVPVTFENFGKKYTVNYALVLENGNWKIEDIKYAEGYNLVGMYK